MESSLLEYMDESTGEIEDIFQEFILTRKEGENSVVYSFFEGKDDYSYYSFRIRKYTQKDIVPYECDGKTNVLTLYSMIKNNTKAFEENDLLFFIDKDFESNNIDCKDIYVTEGYAIENFYITDSAFDEFLKGEIHISKYSKGDNKIDYDNVVKYYREKREEFINRTTLLNTWYSLEKKKSKECNNRQNPDLSQIKIVNCKKLRGEITIEKLKKLTPNYIEVSELELENEKRKLLNNPIRNFRGKYFEEFLYKILGEIITDSNSPNRLFSKKRRVALAIGKDSLVSLLSQYADTPEDLNKYLKEVLKVKDEVASDME